MISLPTSGVAYDFGSISVPYSQNKIFRLFFAVALLLSMSCWFRLLLDSLSLLCVNVPRVIISLCVFRPLTARFFNISFLYQLLNELVWCCSSVFLLCPISQDDDGDGNDDYFFDNDDDDDDDRKSLKKSHDLCPWLAASNDSKGSSQNLGECVECRGFRV